ncbi:heparinase II/III-family protein [Dyella sp.]|jgi:hypothetical protein|uniref:heparinase II/III family protein n=1 Tax=Dyella sp. TaxID=1869338 RepID=UPI002D784E01|nr:heparinase II/III-family protein [Dyella sp.]HET6430819.1 heparinase II/III-family protein [Dyella sp.]
MTMRSKLLLGCVAVAAFGIAGAVLFRHARYAGPMPQPIALQKSDFMVFGGDYEAQNREGFQPRADVSPFPLQHPLDWNTDPFNDRNWQFQLSAWRMLNPIWSRWYGRDWPRLVDELMPWIHDWYVYHVVQKKQSEFEWYDMSTGYRAQHLALLLWLQKKGRLTLSPGQLHEVRALAHWHIAKLRDPDFITHGNHAIFQLQGLRLLCLAWADDACRGEEAYTARLMGNLLRSQFGKDGVQTENSPGYHLFVLDTFARIRPALYPPIERDFARTLAQARAVAPWFTLPDGQVVPMGDSAGHGAKFPREGVPACSSRDRSGSCIISKDLIAGGYAVVRTSPGTVSAKASMLIVDGASVVPRSHDHADELSFELYTGGRRVLVDSGKFSYNDDRWHRYFQSNRAHNVVGVEGRSFGPDDTVTDGSALQSMVFEDGSYIVTGQVERKGMVHRRRISYRPDESVLVADHLEGAGKMRPVVYWHLAPELDATVTGTSVDVAAGDDIVARVALLEGNCSPAIVRGQGGGTIQGWVSPSYLKRRPATVIEYRCAPGVQNIRTRIGLAGPATIKSAKAP